MKEFPMRARRERAAAEEQHKNTRSAKDDAAQAREKRIASKLSRIGKPDDRGAGIHIQKHDRTFPYMYTRA